MLLTEGSSLTSREVITCLGPPGYELEVLDADPLCVARFSRWVRRVHRCPPAGADPLAYVRTLERVVAERGIDVVLPTHEQAWLLSCARPLLASSVWVALAGADAFARVQSKIAFAQLLDELGLPQPEWRLVQGAQDLDDLQVRLTLGEELPGPARVGRAGVRTHGTIALLLGATARGESRRALLGEMRDAIAHRGVYAGSAEQLTPLLRDPPSAIAAAFVAARVLLAPRAATQIAGHAVSGYAIGPASVAQVQALVAARSAL